VVSHEAFCLVLDAAKTATVVSGGTGGGVGGLFFCCFGWQASLALRMQSSLSSPNVGVWVAITCVVTQDSCLRHFMQKCHICPHHVQASFGLRGGMGSCPGGGDFCPCVASPFEGGCLAESFGVVLHPQEGLFLLMSSAVF